MLARRTPPEDAMVESTNWWGRHWKWFAPMGCLTIVLLLALVIGGVMALVFGMMKSSDVYAQALDRARASPEVAAVLGTPVEEGLFVTGQWSESATNGSAELSIPLSGPKGDGTLHVVAEKSGGTWRFSTLVIESASGMQGGDAGEADAAQDAAPLPDLELQPVEPTAPGTDAGD
jgi:hypothetical protein